MKIKIKIQTIIKFQIPIKDYKDSNTSQDGQIIFTYKMYNKTM